MGCHPFGGEYAAVFGRRNYSPHSGYQGRGVRNGCSPHDRVDGGPHKQQDFVGWAPGLLPWAVTPIRHPRRGEQPDQDGPHQGQGHKDGPFRPHSPPGGEICRVRGTENMLTVSLPRHPFSGSAPPSPPPI